jgi:hypothetical protein
MPLHEQQGCRLDAQPAGESEDHHRRHAGHRSVHEFLSPRMSRRGSATCWSLVVSMAGISPGARHFLSLGAVWLPSGDERRPVLTQDIPALSTGEHTEAKADHWRAAPEGVALVAKGAGSSGRYGTLSGRA